MDDDDLPRLPADTLKLLQDFNQENDKQAKRFEDLKNQSENAFQTEDSNDKLSMDLFGEDWNASQFWYTDATARVLAKQLLSTDFDGVHSDVNPDAVNQSGQFPETAIAVISAPSVYIALRNLLSECATISLPKLCLLEFDKRFEVLGPDFIFYDYQQPLNLPKDLKGAFDCIICDPPFLSDDCQAKTALTARFLAKRWSAEALTSPSSDGVKFITCTGERMEPLINKLYNAIGVKTTTFEPEHSKGLSNEFRCYANFECQDWSWR